MAEQWFYSNNNERHGPVDELTLKRLIADGAVISSSLVWKAGMDNWVPVQTVDALIAASTPIPSTQPSPPPLIPSSRPPVATNQSNSFFPTSTQPAGGADANLVYPSNPPQSKWLCLVNLLLPGVAQIILGQVAKGWVIIIVAIISLATVVGVFGVCIAAIVDAYQVGVVLSSGRPIKKWDFFPK